MGTLWRRPPDRNSGLWSGDTAKLWATKRERQGNTPTIPLPLSSDLLQSTATGLPQPAASRQRRPLKQHTGAKLLATGLMKGDGDACGGAKMTLSKTLSILSYLFSY